MARKLVAEFVGTYALVFCGTGAIIINDISSGSVTHLGIAITFGLIVVTMIFAFGNISGAHINPAVTFGFFIDRKIGSMLVLYYIFAQLSGALLASLSLKLLFPAHQNLGNTIPAGSNLQSLFLEILLTFFLMIVILRTIASEKTKPFVAISVGMIVLLEALFAGPITGASMNPARSFGPAIISGNISYLWIYIVAPVIGASLAVLLEKMIFRQNGDSTS